MLLSSVLLFRLTTQILSIQSPFVYTNQSYRMKRTINKISSLILLLTKAMLIIRLAAGTMLIYNLMPCSD